MIQLEKQTNIKFGEISRKCGLCLDNDRCWFSDFTRMCYIISSVSEKRVLNFIFLNKVRNYIIGYF